MCFSFPFGFEDGMCDFIPDGCLSIYLSDLNTNLIYNETCFRLSNCCRFLQSIYPLPSGLDVLAQPKRGSFVC